MDENDKRLAESKAELKILIDSSAFLSLRDIATATGTHPLNLLIAYPNIDYFFASAMLNELARGKEGFSQEIMGMYWKSLQDEMVGAEGLKDARHLYSTKGGSTRTVTLTKISGVDSGQILLCQNHKDLVLLTNDHKMQKNAAALLDRRLMDVLNLLELMSETPNKKLRGEWLRLRKWYETNSGYNRPKTVRFIEDRQPGELPPHLRL